MNGYSFGEKDKVGLVFTTILDEITLGLDDEEEAKEVTDRKYWLTNRGTEKTVAMADEILEIINSFGGGYEPRYTKFYIGLAKDGKPNNFVISKPQKSALVLEIRLPYSDDIQKLIIENELDDMGYMKRWGIYRLRINDQCMKTKKEIISNILKLAYQNSL